MNYYIVTEQVFKSLTKDNIKFMRKSIDETKRLISTTDTVDSTLEQFSTIEECSTYTYTNHSEWVGDNTGIDVWEIEDDEYIEELDN
jgi:hypothetical protein|tara:strand:- start:652 stop:912 length:261 start_codon:yes stop_codon:yes gene_type:complete